MELQVLPQGCPVGSHRDGRDSRVDRRTGRNTPPFENALVLTAASAGKWIISSALR